MMPKLEVDVRVVSEHDTHADFSCGDDDLVDFLRNDALTYQQWDIARTFVAYARHEAADGRALLGFIALSTDAVKLTTTERRKIGWPTTSHPVVPALKVGRLAVDSRVQGRGVGTTLLGFALGVALRIEPWAGCRFLTVDAYPKSQGWYAKQGFVINKAKRPDTATCSECGQSTKTLSASIPPDANVSMRFDFGVPDAELAEWARAVIAPG